MNHAITPTASRGMKANNGRAPTKANKEATQQRTIDSDLFEIALRLADRMARCDIEYFGCCVKSDGQEWLDPTQVLPQRHPEDAEDGLRDMAEAAAYLQLRGAQAAGFTVERNPAFPHLLRFVVADEDTP